MHVGNPHFLLALAGIAVPVLIYLLTRQRVKQVAFSTLRFFAGASSLLVRRKKLHEMLLLALRVAACALLALAFARPFLAAKNGTVAGMLQAPSARVIVADLSGSMNRDGLPGKVRQAVLAALQEAPRNAAVALVGFDQTARVLVPPSTEPAGVQDAAATLAPGQGGTDLSGAIRKADELLRRIQAPAKEIVVLSDLPRSGWGRFRGEWNLEPGVKLTVHALTPETGGGLAIVAADCPQSVVAENEPRALTVRVANFADTEAKDVPVTLTVAGKEIATNRVAIPAHGQTAVRFRHHFTASGDNPGMITVAGGRVPPQVYYFNTRLIPRIPILILAATPGAAGARDGVFFLRTALTPSADSPFVAEVVKPAAVTPAQVRQAAVVILADVAAVPPAIRTELAAVPARGGGLLFLPGPQTQAEVFNASFGDLAPAKLRRPLTASAAGRGDGKAVVGRIDVDHPVFELFQRPHYGDFSAVTFDRYWEVTDSQLCRVPARFDDGRPLLLEKNLGAGMSMLMACPVDLAWSNFPLRAIFLPYLHQVMRCMSLRTERPTAFLVGQTLPAAPGETVQDAEGKPLGGGAAAVAERAGMYTLVNAEGKKHFVYAVNQDPAEADAAVVEPKEIVAALQREGAAADAVAPAARGESTLTAAAGPRRELWAYLLGALALLLVGELWVANRTTEQ